MSVEPFVETTQGALAGQIVGACFGPTHLTVSAIADFLSISKMTIYCLVYSGDLTPRLARGRSEQLIKIDALRTPCTGRVHISIDG